MKPCGVRRRVLLQRYVSRYRAENSDFFSWGAWHYPDIIQRNLLAAKNSETTNIFSNIIDVADIEL